MEVRRPTLLVVNQLVDMLERAADGASRCQFDHTGLDQNLHVVTDVAKRLTNFARNLNWRGHPLSLEEGDYSLPGSVGVGAQ